MATTPNLGITLLEAAQAQKHVTVNEGFLRLDELGAEITVDLDLTGGVTTADLFPARSIVLGASWRVIEEITFSGGGVTWALGDPGDGAGVAANATRYSSGISPAVGSNGSGPVTPFAIFGGMPLELEPDAGAITGGVVRLRAFWRALTIPAA